MARHFGYYDDWKTSILACACGWAGTFEQGTVHHFRELKDSSCPRCDTMLAIVPYPTITETEKHWDQLTDEEKQEVSARKRFLAEWEATSLKSADQLPDLEGSALTLAWDIMQRAPGEREYTVLRHDDKEVWRELACYEGYERFREVVEILKAKYGHRLRDVVPTEASGLYLYGDSSSAIQIVQDIRDSFGELRRASKPIPSDHALQRLKANAIVGTSTSMMSSFQADAIRANLASSWAFGLQMEKEEREEAEAQAQCEQALLDRIEAQPESQREGFLAEIATLTQAGQISPYHARRLRWAVQGNKPKRKRKRNQKR